jgi:hypothetical protein
MGLMVGVGANVEPLVEGRVRLAPPAAGAQVMLFDGTDLGRSVRRRVGSGRWKASDFP